MSGVEGQMVNLGSKTQEQLKCPENKGPQHIDWPRIGQNDDKSWRKTLKGQMVPCSCGRSLPSLTSRDPRAFFSSFSYCPPFSTTLSSFPFFPLPKGYHRVKDAPVTAELATCTKPKAQRVAEHRQRTNTSPKFFFSSRNLL